MSLNATQLIHSIPVDETTGAISVGPFDIDRYIKDSILDIGVMNVHNSLVTAFRDKRQPLKPGAIRLLPANLLKRIPAHLLIDTLKMNNGHVEYSEFNEKTNKPPTPPPPHRQIPRSIHR